MKAKNLKENDVKIINHGGGGDLVGVRPTMHP